MTEPRIIALDIKCRACHAEPYQQCINLIALRVPSYIKTFHNERKRDAAKLNTQTAAVGLNISRYRIHAGSPRCKDTHQ
jgi:hypothetical protein